MEAADLVRKSLELGGVEGETRLRRTTYRLVSPQCAWTFRMVVERGHPWRARGCRHHSSQRHFS